MVRAGAGGLGIIAILAAGVQAQPPRPVDQSLETPVRFQAVSVVSPQIAWISGTRGTWSRTVDGGAAWETGVVPDADSLEFRDVHAVDADRAWLLAAGQGALSRIYHTADGGRTWRLQFLNDEPRAFFDCLAFWDERRGVAVSDAVDRRFLVLRTDDGGDTWLPVDHLPPAREGEGMFAASGTCVVTHGDRHAWIGTGAGLAARVLRTGDGGASWSVAETPVVHHASTAGITSLAFFDSMRGLALGGDIAAPGIMSDNVARTDDGGATWRLTGRPTFPGAVYGAAVVPGRGESVIAVGPGGASWSTDGGATWRPLDSRNFWSVGFGPGGVGWMVGPGGRVVRVTWE
jgi:photosystem II stability/assembly factor-like uncharacterized protein